MRILFDTNVILDLMLARRPHDRAARSLASLVARDEMIGFVGATTVTTIFYIASKHIGAGSARETLAKLLKVFRVAPVTDAVVRDALASSFDDFEDAILHEAGIAVGVEGIVTRDALGFRRASCTVHTPDGLLASVAGEKPEPG